MSVFSKVVGFFSGAVSTVVGAAKDAWGAIATVWAFLVQTYHALSEAWNWVVNGIEFFTREIESWAAQVFNGIRHILFTVIPNAVTYAVTAAERWAGHAVAIVSNWAKAAIANAIKWVERELAKAAAFVRNLVASVVRWVTGPINWVLKVGKRVGELVLHPEALVKWIIGSLVVPLVMWLLRSSVPVLVWLVRSFLTRSHEAETVLEDFISKVI